MVKNLPASAGDVRDTLLSLGREGPLQEGMATHSSILAWRIPRAEEPGGLQSWGREESDTTERLSTHAEVKGIATAGGGSGVSGREGKEFSELPLYGPWCKGEDSLSSSFS